MKTYALSGAADADVRRILDHPVRQWGITRAEQYVGQLHAAFERIGCFPKSGTGRQPHPRTVQAFSARQS